MAANVTETITVLRDGTSHEVGAVVVLVAGDHYQHSQITIDIVEEQVSFGSDIATPGWLYMRNRDSSNYIDVGFETGVYPLRLYAGEQQRLSLAPTTTSFFAVADTAPCKLEFEISERDT